MFYLRLFGSPRLEDAAGVALTGRGAQRHRLGLLGLLALAGNRGSSRDRLAAFLWPERSAGRARNLLKVSVYVLRKALGEAALLSEGDELCLNPDCVETDVRLFEEALAADDAERAVSLYAGPLLDGFFLRDAPEFERWIDGQRSRLALAYARALESLADAASLRGDILAAVEWWRARAALDPFDSRIAVRLSLALEAAGNPAGALRQLTAHETLLRDELGIEAAPELREQAQRLRLESQGSGAARSGSPMSSPLAAGSRADPAPVPAPYRLRTLGALELDGPGGAPAGATRDRRLLALLAVLAVSGADGISRDRLMLLFWPELTRQAAREALDRWLESIRATIHEDAVLGSDPLVLNPAVVASDVAGTERDAGDRALDDHLPDDHLFLEGIDDEASPELLSWLRLQRERLARRPSAFVDMNVSGETRQGIEPIESWLPSVPGRQQRLRLAMLLTAAAVSLGALLVFIRRSPSADDIARSVADRLAPAASAQRPTARVLTRNAAALERYELCGHTRVLRTDSLAREALACLRDATRLDPEFAAAWAGLALMYTRVAPAGDPDMSLTDRLRIAEEYAQRSATLDPSLAETHRTLGLVRMFEYRFAEAEAELRWALELDPADPRTHEFLVHLMVFRGRFEDALGQARASIEAEPLSPTANAELARAYLVNDRCDDALALLSRLRDLDPPVGRARTIAAECYGEKGMWGEALSEMEGGGGNRSVQLSELAYFNARAGRTAEAERMLAELVAQWDRTRSNAFRIALIHWGLGNRDSTFVWLGRSVEDHSFTYEAMHPRWAGLRDDPRFGRLVERLGISRDAGG